jgi:hypothetical protein
MRDFEIFKSKLLWDSRDPKLVFTRSNLHLAGNPKKLILKFRELQKIPKSSCCKAWFAGIEKNNCEYQDIQLFKGMYNPNQGTSQP